MIPADMDDAQLLAAAARWISLARAFAVETPGDRILLEMSRRWKLRKLTEDKTSDRA